MSVASIFSLAPSIPLKEQDVDCRNEEVWDELAVILQSAAGLQFGKVAPTKLIQKMAISIFRRPGLGLLECPVGVLALLISLMIMSREQRHAYRGLSKAVMHLMLQVGGDITSLVSSRWPIFRQLALLEKTMGGFSWSPELEALKFICIPKTGGTSVLTYGMRHGYRSWGQSGGQLGTCPIRHCSAEWWQHDPDITACVVRNPYDRVLSAALWRGVRTILELDEWVYANLPHVWRNQDLEDNLILPSHAFVVSKRGETKCGHVLHTENLSAEFCGFLGGRMQTLDVADCVGEMDVLASNVNLNRRLALSDFSNNAIRIINEVFRIDFEMFGYHMATDALAMSNLKWQPRPHAKRGWQDDETGRRTSHYHGRTLVT